MSREMQPGEVGEPSTPDSGLPPSAITDPATTPPFRQNSNALATPALIGALLFAPAGIILGHISLSQIKKTGEGGKTVAVIALVLGYSLLALGIVTWVVIISIISSVNNSWEDASATATEAEMPEITSSSEVISAKDPSDPIGNTIRSLQIGDCLYRESRDGQITSIRRVDCERWDAYYRVDSVTTESSDCLSENWVRSRARTGNETDAVVCLSKYRAD